MSFKDIIQREQQKVEESQGGNNARVEYPKTKHQRLFFQKGERELLLQVLPASDMVSTFAEPVRKIFLNAMTSQGKQLNVNFTLSPDLDHGSLLEKKITEWGDKGMIPNGFGGQQTSRRLYLVNVVRIVQDVNGNYVQERDQEGNLVVRVFEMPQSAYSNLLTKLGDPMYNASGTDYSFMDINKPNPVKISKPAKGQMEYPVDVYVNITLPPLGQGWENQLEDLTAQAVPTERLENGAQWVQAFVDMKEGRKPNQNQNSEGDQGQGQGQVQQQPQTNPYAQGQGQGQVQQQHQQPMGAPLQQQYQQAPTQTEIPQAPQNLNNEGFLGGQGQPQQQYQQAPQTPTQQAMPEMPQQMPMTNQEPQGQAQGQVQQPQQTQNQTPTAPPNNNGLMDIDAMLDAELGS